MGLSRNIVHVEPSTRTAGADDRIAPAGTPLWVVSWTVQERVGHERTWTAPCTTEVAARRMVRNLLGELAPGLTVDDVYLEQLD